MSYKETIKVMIVYCVLKNQLRHSPHLSKTLPCLHLHDCSSFSYALISCNSSKKLCQSAGHCCYCYTSSIPVVALSSTQFHSKLDFPLHSFLSYVVCFTLHIQISWFLTQCSIMSVPGTTTPGVSTPHMSAPY